MPLGLSLTLSQAPCQDNNTSACCAVSNGRSRCARWAGFHMASTNCISYGSFEVVMAYRMPPGTFSVFYIGLYSGTGPNRVNPWQEIDMGWTGFDVVDGAVVFNSTFITDAYMNGTLIGGPRVSLGPWSDALQFRRYRMEWYPGSLSWYVDDALVHSLNGTDVPDIPQSLRVILRTANGRGDGPDSNIWIKMMKYTALR